MDKMDIIDNAGLIEDTITAISALITQIDQESTMMGRTPTVNYYCIAILAMLDKVSEYSTIIQKAAE